MAESETIVLLGVADEAALFEATGRCLTELETANFYLFREPDLDNAATAFAILCDTQELRVFRDLHLLLGGEVIT